MRSPAPSRSLPQGHADSSRTRAFRATRWPLRVVAIGVVAAFSAAGFLGWHAAASTTPAQLPVLGAPEGAPLRAASATSPSAAVSQPATLAPSRAVQVVVPNADPDLVIDSSVEALDGCRAVIDPPRRGPNVGGVFGCTDFDQPGTSSPGLTVLAGHSSRTLDAVFNKLYAQGPALQGRTVYVRTESSGDRWLAYRVDQVLTPQQGDLPYLTSVWGGDGSSTAGRLVLVTCQQNDDGTPATANYVAIAQFAGVS